MIAGGEVSLLKMVMKTEENFQKNNYGFLININFLIFFFFSFIMVIVDFIIAFDLFFKILHATQNNNNNVEIKILIFVVIYKRFLDLRYSTPMIENYVYTCLYIM